MKQPNIVLILIDDMGWKDLACFGSDFYETPNIDQLARESMLFTDAYASCPVCSPTRASIMSGKYPATVGLTNWIGAHARGKLIDAPYIKELPLEEKSLARALSDGGYATWHVGKWHLGQRPFYPENHGFQVNIGGAHNGHPVNGYFSPYKIETMEDGPEGEYLTDRLTDDAIDLIRKNKGQPFFLNLWHYTVHTPIQAKEADIDYFQKKQKSLELDKFECFIEGEYHPCDHKKDIKVVRRIVQSDPAYAAMIYNLDANIGRLIKAIKDEGLEEETVVIFSSDNGGLSTSEGSPTCNAPLSEGKGWMYEGGVRVPLLVKWPGQVLPKTQSNIPVTSPDLYPTILGMAGLPEMPEQHVDGVSMLPLLKGGRAINREAIYWHYPHYGNQGGTPGSSIRMGDYKLIEFFEDGRLELYNLRQDIEEKVNLVNEAPEIARTMQKKLAHWRLSVEGKIPEVNLDYKA